jgi:hypothetical protein
MPISVANPVSPAIERTRLVLFRPFDIGKWFTLGFCAFLAFLGEGGSGNFNPNTGGQGGGGGVGEQVKKGIDWLDEHMALVLALAAVGLLVGLALSALFTWLSSRGKFMLLDGIVHNRAAVKAPWREYQREGNSLFGFRFLFGLASMVVFFVDVGLALALAWPDIQSRTFGSSATLALAVGIPLFVLIALATGLINLFLQDFVVPIMYLRRIRVLEAWRVFRDSFLAGRVGTFVLYVLFKIILGIAVGVVALFLFCITCCLAIIPYLGSVILLPVEVFVVAYPLYFIEQFGPEWRFFPPEYQEHDDRFEADQREGPDDRPPDERFHER